MTLRLHKELSKERFSPRAAFDNLKSKIHLGRRHGKEAADSPVETVSPMKYTATLPPASPSTQSLYSLRSSTSSPGFRSSKKASAPLPPVERVRNVVVRTYSHDYYSREERKLEPLETPKKAVWSSVESVSPIKNVNETPPPASPSTQSLHSLRRSPSSPGFRSSKKASAPLPPVERVRNVVVRTYSHDYYSREERKMEPMETPKKTVWRSVETFSPIKYENGTPPQASPSTKSLYSQLSLNSPGFRSFKKGSALLPPVDYVLNSSDESSQANSDVKAPLPSAQNILRPVVTAPLPPPSPLPCNIFAQKPSVQIKEPVAKSKSTPEQQNSGDSKREDWNKLMSDIRSQAAKRGLKYDGVERKEKEDKPPATPKKTTDFPTKTWIITGKRRNADEPLKVPSSQVSPTKSILKKNPVVESGPSSTRDDSMSEEPVPFSVKALLNEMEQSSSHSESDASLLPDGPTPLQTIFEVSAELSDNCDESSRTDSDLKVPSSSTQPNIPPPPLPSNIFAKKHPVQSKKPITNSKSLPQQEDNGDSKREDWDKLMSDIRARAAKRCLKYDEAEREKKEVKPPATPKKTTDFPTKTWIITGTRRNAEEPLKVPSSVVSPPKSILKKSPVVEPEPSSTRDDSMSEEPVPFSVKALLNEMEQSSSHSESEASLLPDGPTPLQTIFEVSAEFSEILDESSHIDSDPMVPLPSPQLNIPPPPLPSNIFAKKPPIQIKKPATKSKSAPEQQDSGDSKREDWDKLMSEIRAHAARRAMKYNQANG